MKKKYVEKKEKKEIQKKQTCGIEKVTVLSPYLLE